MKRDDAYILMFQTLHSLKVDAEKLSKQAKNPAARKAAAQRVKRIEAALKAAEEATA
jgi:hypothetical protein